MPRYVIYEENSGTEQSPTIQGLIKNRCSVVLCCPRVGILEITRSSIPTSTQLMLLISWASPPSKPFVITVTAATAPAACGDQGRGERGDPALWPQPHPAGPARPSPPGTEAGAEEAPRQAATPGTEQLPRLSNHHRRRVTKPAARPGPAPHSWPRGGGAWRERAVRVTSSADGAGAGTVGSARRWWGAVRRDDERQRGAELRRTGNTRSLSALPGRASPTLLSPSPGVVARPCVPVPRPGRSGWWSRRGRGRRDAAGEETPTKARGAGGGRGLAGEDGGWPGRDGGGGARQARSSCPRARPPARSTAGLPGAILGW